MEDFKVILIGGTLDAQTLSVAGALACREEKPSSQIYQELKNLPPERRLKKERAVLENSFGRGHGSIGDQNIFIFSIEDLPRAATLQLCLPEYLAHLQQSLRKATASRGFHLPEAIKQSRIAGKVKDILSHSFELYEKMSQAKIPKEDARFLLPLYTRTNIQTAGNARELTHLWSMSQNEQVPSIVKVVVDKMMFQAKEAAPHLFEDYTFNYEQLAWYPSAQLYYIPENTELIALVCQSGDKDISLVDKATAFPLTNTMMEAAIKEKNEVALANLKHVHFDFLCGMSIACLHQAIRQRTWNHSIESIYHAALQAINNEARMVIPPSIRRSRFYSEYQEQHQKMLNLLVTLKEDGVAINEAIGVVPHSIKIYTLVHVNGWNAIHAIGKRTCKTAQWEIRKIAKNMARIIKEQMPVLGQWAKPQCITYGGCPEAEDCDYYDQHRNK